MNRRSGLLLAVLAASLTAVWLLADRAGVPTRTEPTPAAAPRPPAEPASVPVLRSLAPGGRIEVANPRAPSGILCPDGTFLPLLNGVPHAPALSRDPRFGPVPAVVARIADAQGCEYWLHADGSTTTSRWIDYAGPDGRRQRQVVTDHAIAVPQTLGR